MSFIAILVSIMPSCAIHPFPAVYHDGLSNVNVCVLLSIFNALELGGWGADANLWPAIVTGDGVSSVFYVVGVVLERVW
jgi:hypothetical protein